MITKYALRNKILAPLLLIVLSMCCALTTSVHAQIVHIPDDNLRTAVRHALKGTIPTNESMQQLTVLDAGDQEIVDLTGLEHATNLTRLVLRDNPISDLSPISNLTKLEHLDIAICSISDLTPLSNLVNLKYLTAQINLIANLGPLARLTNLIVLILDSNLIRDITPLAGLTNLVELSLSKNRIRDATPLAGLMRLEILFLGHNDITDHSPLDTLTLADFIYDQTCEMPPLPLQPRLANKTYPSVAARWSGYGWPPVRNRPDLSDAENIALHDLWFHGDEFELRPRDVGGRSALAGKLDLAIHRRDELLSLNPNLVILMSLATSAADIHAFPEDSPYWIRNDDGTIFRNHTHNGRPKPYWLVDYTHPDIQDRIVEQAIAVSKCGLYDGIFFDTWSEVWPILSGFDANGVFHVFGSLEAERQARLNIVQRIRAHTRPNFLIMGNVNDNIIPVTGTYLNGGFMEVGTPEGDSMLKLPKTLTWLENNLREPSINALEGGHIPGEPPDSAENLRWVRAFTTLNLTHSDGYVGFVSRVDHRTYWYDFWDADLGRSIGPKATLYNDKIPHLFIREFTNGWAVYNHSGAEQTITLPELASGVASGLEDMKHTLPNRDGEIYLRAKPANPADVNGDGAVNILDLVAVAQGLGTDNPEADVNGDGVVNVFDLVFVAGAIGGDGVAPPANTLDPSIISAVDVEKWLAGAQGVGVGDANFQRGIRFLQQLLAALTPKETALLPNYPNPFNPETWIPYRLAREADVAITIYDTKGTQMRRLALGNQAAGYYAERGKAAYWDGRNEDGEAVASGIYVYHFQAGDCAASRRMVIVK